jgi:hypothetical protein
MLLITTINEIYSLVPAVVWTTASSLLQDSISPETLEIVHRSTEHKNSQASERPRVPSFFDRMEWSAGPSLNVPLR